MFLHYRKDRFAFEISLWSPLSTETNFVMLAAKLPTMFGLKYKHIVWIIFVVENNKSFQKIDEQKISGLVKVKHFMYKDVQIGSVWMSLRGLNK